MVQIIAKNCWDTHFKSVLYSFLKLIPPQEKDMGSNEKRKILFMTDWIGWSCLLLGSSFRITNIEICIVFSIDQRASCIHRVSL